MGAVNTVESLTTEEKEYYNAILDASKKHWSLIDKKRKNTYIPDIAPEPIRTIVKTVPAVVIPRTLSEMPVIEDVPEDLQEQEIIEDIQMSEEMPAEMSSAMDFPAETSIRSPAETHVETQIKNTTPEPENEETVIIRVLENLPAFSGPDRDYDLKKEDVVRLPAVMAKALINREKAILINVTP
jgi:DNA replication factor GINS